jgi:two-component system, NtrC family, sensor histidine kinase HydH
MSACDGRCGNVSKFAYLHRFQGIGLLELGDMARILEDKTGRGILTMEIHSKYNWIGVAAIAASIVCIGLLRQLVPHTAILLHNVLQNLYVLPIVIAAIYRGWRGGICAALFSGICDTLFTLGTFAVQRTLPDHLASQSAEAVDFLLVGLVAGILADRQQEQKKALQLTTQKLRSVYGELQKNFEHMKRAERLYAIGQLSAGLAHEIRNPLASLSGAIGILRRNPTAADKRLECLDIMDKECQRLNNLLTSFLDFARPRPPKFLAIEIPAVLDSVIGLVSHTLDQRSISLRKETAIRLPALECDPELLKQVLVNLLINAIQASTDGGEILIQARVRGSDLAIQVRDKGTGVSAEDLDKIFDPFFTTKENGTGLGLSVAYQITEQLGGSLRAERNPDRGMTFSVLLPVHSTKIYESQKSSGN